MITSFQIKNLRSIEDSGHVDLKKLTVLVGRNSSGKSTILRTLPLLRQSVEQQTKGPLLWYGRLVDFGNFRNAVRDGDASRGITLIFNASLQAKRRTSLRSAARDGEWLVPSRTGVKVSLTLTIGRSSEDRVGHIRGVSLRIGSDDLNIEFQRTGGVQMVEAMGERVDLASDEEWWIRRGSIVPELILLEEHSYQVDEDEIETLKEPASRPFARLIDSALRQISHGNMSPERLRAIGSRLLYGNEQDFFKQLLVAPAVSSALQHRLNQLGSHAVEIRALRRAVLLRHLGALLRALDEDLVRFAKSVRYIEPIRASAERFYREQDLAVDDIDSSGANTAVFLSSLSDASLLQLQSWMLENFGFRVEVESATGHIQVKISDGVSASRNIADLGFGYSQMLPIILQLWKSSRFMPGEVAPTLAIEQPELHLHPHYQAMLADVMVATASSGHGSIFVETHSDHFVNRLGALTAEGTIDPDDVQMLVVSEDDFGDTVARKVRFNSDGMLSSNWPVGFFTPQPL